MKTETLILDDQTDATEPIRRAADVLASGGLVAFPTETVYGLGANVADPEALARLRKVKQRTNQKPFAVHIARPDDVKRFVPDLSVLAKRLIAKGWPGPLALLFPVETPESAPVMADVAPKQLADIYFEGIVGIRCPDHPVASDLLGRANVPVVAASANLAGQRPPVTAHEVLQDLDGKIDLLLDAGRTRYTKASTIVRLNSNGYELVREGVWDERTVKRLSRMHVLFVCTGNTCRSPMAQVLYKKTLAERIGCKVEELEECGYVVESAGVMAPTGCRASNGAIQALGERGLDLAHHASQPLTVEIVNQADCIYTMTESHRQTVIALVPSKADRVRKLKSDCDIQDPLGSGDEVYRQCAASIGEAIRNRLEELSI